MSGHNLNLLIAAMCCVGGVLYGDCIFERHPSVVNIWFKKQPKWFSAYPLDVLEEIIEDKGTTLYKFKTETEEALVKLRIAPTLFDGEQLFDIDSLYSSHEGDYSSVTEDDVSHALKNMTQHIVTMLVETPVSLARAEAYEAKGWKVTKLPKFTFKELLESIFLCNGKLYGSCVHNMILDESKGEKPWSQPRDLIVLFTRAGRQKFLAKISENIIPDEHGAYKCRFGDKEIVIRINVGDQPVPALDIDDLVMTNFDSVTRYNGDSGKTLVDSVLKKQATTVTGTLQNLVRIERYRREGWNITYRNEFLQSICDMILQLGINHGGTCAGIVNRVEVKVKFTDYDFIPNLWSNHPFISSLPVCLDIDIEHDDKVFIFRVSIPTYKLL